jgi:hypothetical protein
VKSRKTSSFPVDIAVAGSAPQFLTRLSEALDVITVFIPTPQIVVLSSDIQFLVDVPLSN